MEIWFPDRVSAIFVAYAGDSGAPWGVTEPCSLELVLVYQPAALEVIEVQNGARSNSAMLDFGTRTPGRLWTGLIDTNGISGDGPVAIVSFNLIGWGAADSPLVLERVSAYDATTPLDVLTVSTAGNFERDLMSIAALALTFPR